MEGELGREKQNNYEIIDLYSSPNIVWGSK
jgi:hypothetical protein